VCSSSFLIQREFSAAKSKARRLLRRRAFGFFDLSGRLVQAIAVRRHGYSMMVVMTVVAAALHLFQK
jgi:hypothetical protein